MRPLLLFLAVVPLVLAGCLEERATQTPTAASPTPTPTPTPTPSPTPMPTPPKGAPQGGDGCIVVELTSVPTPLAPGDGARFAARATNTCPVEARLQGNDGCSRDGFAGHIVDATGARHLLRPSGAAGVTVCTEEYPPPVVLAPGAFVEATWDWNGTISRDFASYEALERGDHLVEARALLGGGRSVVATAPLRVE